MWRARAERWGAMQERRGPKDAPAHPHRRAHAPGCRCGCGQGQAGGGECCYSTLAPLKTKSPALSRRCGAQSRGPALNHTHAPTPPAPSNAHGCRLPGCGAQSRGPAFNHTHMHPHYPPPQTHMVADCPDVGLKAEVQHAVCLIQHQVGDLLQGQGQGRHGRKGPQHRVDS